MKTRSEERNNNKEKDDNKEPYRPRQKTTTTIVYLFVNITILQETWLHRRITSQPPDSENRSTGGLAQIWQPSPH